MPRLIDADEFKKENARLLHCDFPYLSEETLEELIDEAPTVDAEPVKHGHWNEAKDGTLWCSVCTSTGPYDEDYYGYVLNAPHYDYCPHCGAKMEEEDATETG